ncbi:hypothetical protein [Mycolicibacterium sp. S3B2]|uniref:hypothetical protein n=1 Tax=Mycolicibacterium sp. S3B2 TaxID=3415120 RepID=UPI003C7BE7AF
MNGKKFGQSEVHESLTRFTDFTNELMRFSTTIGRDIVMGMVKRDHAVQARQHAILEALVLTASWGALESFVEDVVKASLRDRQGQVDTRKLNQFKFSAEDLLSSVDERIDVIFKAITSAAGKGVGIGKFEKLLDYVDLDGQVPHLVKTGIFETQQIRNIWAHKAGRADKRFVDAAPSLGFSEGDNVEISSEALYHYILNMVVYAAIVCSRYMVSNGWKPIRLAYGRGDPSVDAYMELYPVNEDSEPGT